MQVGTYTSPTAPKTNGKWVGATEVMIDSGTMYASKDFFDPVKKRRINWGWARQGPSCISSQTLPREVTWHPELQQLVHSPLEEQNALRGDVLGKISAGTSIRGPQDIIDHKQSKDAGRQAEIRVSFARPAAPARLSVTVMDGREFVVQYDGNTNTTATCSCCPKCYTNNRTSTYPKMSKLNLLDTDTTIDMTLYVDHTLIEFYAMNGRVALTTKTGANKTFNGAIVSSSIATSVEATAWAVNSIWVTPEEVKNGQ